MPSSNHLLSDERPLHVSNVETPLDDDRLASMADEGGVSGALMEIDDDDERKHLMSRLRRSRRGATWRTAVAAFALLGIAVVVTGWLKRAT